MKIPFLSIPDSPLSSTTQDHIPIADIKDDLIIYKNGSVTMILESTSLNFGLLSRKEQQAVIAGYAALLNSLNFHIQIVVSSKRKDVSSYLRMLENLEKNISNPKLINIMQGYKKFMLDSIRRKNVLSKSFYIVVPFTSVELGVSKSITKSFSSKKTNTPLLPYTESYIIRKAKIALYPKREHLSRQARRLGIQLRQLLTTELIQLIYDLYNPHPPVKDKNVFD